MKLKKLRHILRLVVQKTELQGKHDLQPLKSVMASFLPNSSIKFQNQKFQFRKEKRFFPHLFPNLFTLHDQFKSH